MEPQLWGRHEASLRGLNAALASAGKMQPLGTSILPLPGYGTADIGRLKTAVASVRAIGASAGIA